MDVRMLRLDGVTCAASCSRHWLLPGVMSPLS
jgi:hypothetical protein